MAESSRAKWIENSTLALSVASTLVASIMAFNLDSHRTATLAAVIVVPSPFWALYFTVRIGAANKHNLIKSVADDALEKSLTRRFSLVADGSNIIDLAFARRRDLESNTGDGSQPTGVLATIDSFYGAIKYRRMIIVGSAGAGKTVLANELAIKIVDSTRAPEYAVIPVLLSLSSWVPGTDFDRWLTRSLAAELRLGQRLTRSLQEKHYLLPVLDGLDDVETNKVGGASELLYALGKSMAGRGQRPLVLCCREDVYRIVPANRRPPNSVVIGLQDLDSADINRYLDSRYGRSVVTPHHGPAGEADQYHEQADKGDDPQSQKSASGWSLKQRFKKWPSLLTWSRKPPPPLEPGHTQELIARKASVISTPWLLAVVTAVCDAGLADVEEFKKTMSEHDLERLLLPKLIPAMFTAHPPQSRSGKAKYTEQEVHRWLKTLADYLKQQQRGSKSAIDINLHELWPLGGSRRICIYHAAIAVPGAALLALVGAEVTTGNLGWAITLLWATIGIGLGVWAAVDLKPTPLRVDPQRLLKPRSITAAVIAGAYVAAVSVWTAKVSVALTVGIAATCAVALSTSLTRAVTSSKPADLLRGELIFGLALGLSGAVYVGLPQGISGGLLNEYGFQIPGLPGVAAAIPLGIFAGIAIGSRAWLRYMLATKLQALHGRLPWNLVSFLTWAKNAHILRVSGSSYQFRHDNLRVWLSDPPTNE